MSVKDMRYYRLCPICGDRLVGTDDGLEVYESLKEQMESLPEGTTPNCTLCGEDCKNRSIAAEIVAKGEPELFEVGKDGV